MERKQWRPFFFLLLSWFGKRAEPIVHMNSPSFGQTERERLNDWARTFWKVRTHYYAPSPTLLHFKPI
ncbi:MAG: hypothetical protein ACR5K5_00970 [Wolbachia sp.]